MIEVKQSELLGLRLSLEFDNITARRAMVICIVDKIIMSYLNDVFFGPYFFRAVLLFRTSLLLVSWSARKAGITSLKQISNYPTT